MSILAAYCRGVNAFIETHRNNLPLEFRLLRRKPEPYQPLDIPCWAKFMAWSLGCHLQDDLLRGRLIARLGAEQATRLEHSYPATAADREGNIGYYLAGHIPIRASGILSTPVPGWTGEHEWVGVIPFEELPHASNSSSHYVAHANDQPARDDYHHYLGWGWVGTYQAQRIVQLLTSQERSSAKDFARMQIDLHSIPGGHLA